MLIQGYMFEKTPVPSDVVYTPVNVSAGILKFLKPSGKLLDPCKGDGSFYNQMPAGSEYCELQEGLDFFDYNKKVDWVIGNPPYSIFDKFLEKSFEISDNVSFLVPTNKVFQRQVIMERISNWGGYAVLLFTDLVRL
jgi:hypothetical protein